MTRGWFAVSAVPAAGVFVLVFALSSMTAGRADWLILVIALLASITAGFGANRLTSAQRRHVSRASARTDELDRLVATQTAIATSEFDLEAVMAAVVDEARSLTDADAAVVEIPDGPQLVYRAVAGSAKSYHGLRLDRRGTLSGLALDTMEVLTCPDSEHDPRVDRDACRRVGARSMVVVPLVHGERAIGVLKVYSELPDAFEPHHTKLLSLLASMIGTALVRADLMSKLSRQAVTDDLTGLANRRGWYEQLALALARARRSKAALSVIVLDLDGFKKVNDREGHAAGDRLLRTVSSAWLAALREVDVLGRTGGDEFAVALEGADELTAGEVAARLRATGQAVSVGIATWDGREDGASLVARADAAMYRDKQAGAASR